MLKDNDKIQVKMENKGKSQHSRAESNVIESLCGKDQAGAPWNEKSKLRIMFPSKSSGSLSKQWATDIFGSISIVS